jgi:hypothetical protein
MGLDDVIDFAVLTCPVFGQWMIHHVHAHLRNMRSV